MHRTFLATFPLAIVLTAGGCFVQDTPPPATPLPPAPTIEPTPAPTYPPPQGVAVQTPTPATPTVVVQPVPSDPAPPQVPTVVVRAPSPPPPPPLPPTPTVVVQAPPPPPTVVVQAQVPAVPAATVTVRTNPPAPTVIGGVTVHGVYQAGTRPVVGAPPPPTVIGGSLPMSLVLANGSAYTFCFLYLTPTGQATWGDEVLGGQALPPGYELSVSVDATYPAWDLQAQDCNGYPVVEERGRSLPSDGVWTLGAITGPLRPAVPARVAPPPTVIGRPLGPTVVAPPPGAGRATRPPRGRRGSRGVRRSRGAAEPGSAGPRTTAARPRG